MYVQPTDLVARWLLSAAESPAVAVEEWRSRDVALLACGRAFDAVRVPCDLVRLATRATDDTRAGALMHRALGGGPVFLDRVARQVYALTACGAWPAARLPRVEHLGQGCYLGVPRIDRTAPAGRAHWCGPPARCACPTRPLHALIALGLERLGQAEANA
ncbi:hypothetical protein ACWD6I_06840 [Streptomyces sp. NPDC002454]